MSKKLLFTLSGDTLDEIRNQLIDVAAGLGLAFNPSATPAPQLDSSSYTEEPPSKRGRPKKTIPIADTKAQPASSPAVEVEADAEPTNGLMDDAPSVTKEELNIQVRELIGKGKADIARTVLAKFGANNLKELKEQDYAKFLEGLKQATAH